MDPNNGNGDDQNQAPQDPMGTPADGGSTDVTEEAPQGGGQTWDPNAGSETPAGDAPADAPAGEEPAEGGM